MLFEQFDQIILVQTLGLALSGELQADADFAENVFRQRRQVHFFAFFDGSQNVFSGHLFLAAFLVSFAARLLTRLTGSQ